jgi:hypothetical protein
MNIIGCCNEPTSPAGAQAFWRWVTLGSLQQNAAPDLASSHQSAAR